MTDRIARCGISGTRSGYTGAMIIIGIILVIIGAVADIPVVYTIGIIVALVGIVLWVLGAMGRAVGGRKHYW